MNGNWIYIGNPSGNMPPQGWPTTPQATTNGAAQVLAVHAALLPIRKGKILYFGGSSWYEGNLWKSIENEADPESDPQYQQAKSQIDHTRIYDCSTDDPNRILSNPGSPDADLFCCGHAFLADGRLLIAGGTQHFPDSTEGDLHHAHWSGTRETWIFNPNGNPYWSRGLLLNRDPNQLGASEPRGGGRWYPTLITLSNGNIIAMCGHPLIDQFTQNPQDFDDRHNNTKPEVFNTTTNSWILINKALGASNCHDYAVFYPRLHVVPHTGEVFIVQPLYSNTIMPSGPQCTDPTGNMCSENPNDTHPPYTVDVKYKSLFYDVNTQQVTRVFAGPQIIDGMYLNPMYTSQQTTSVMLPLLHDENYHPRVLLCNTIQPLIADLAPTNPNALQWLPTAQRQLIDPTTNRPPIRNFASATLLPTGDVVISGGTTAYGYDSRFDGVKTVEIYHPPHQGQSDSWELSATADETRGYHSVALLMPDGRVWTAGSEQEWCIPYPCQFDPQQPNPSQHGSVSNVAIELFEPNYYSIEDRISITQSPAYITYGMEFNVLFTPEKLVSRVVFIRCGSTTHSFDGDQRYVSVPFEQPFPLPGNEGRLIVFAPPNATIAPPGYYMLWLIDTDNRPCILAPFIQLRQ